MSAHVLGIVGLWHQMMVVLHPRSNTLDQNPFSRIEKGQALLWDRQDKNRCPLDFSWRYSAISMSGVLQPPSSRPPKRGGSSNYEGRNLWQVMGFSLLLKIIMLLMGMRWWYNTTSSPSDDRYIIYIFRSDLALSMIQRQIESSQRTCAWTSLNICSQQQPGRNFLLTGCYNSYITTFNREIIAEHREYTQYLHNLTALWAFFGRGRTGGF